MKSGIKKAPILLVYLFFISCGSPVSKEFIETARDENGRYKILGEQMQASARAQSANEEKQYQGAITRIDPAKRKAFDKDTQLREKISAGRNSLKGLNATYAMFSDSLVELTSANNRQITLFLEEKTDKEEAAEKWTKAKSKIRSYQESSAFVQKEIEEKEKYLGQLYDLVDSKYGRKSKPIFKSKKKR